MLGLRIPCLLTFLRSAHIVIVGYTAVQTQHGCIGSQGEREARFVHGASVETFDIVVDLTSVLVQIRPVRSSESNESVCSTEEEEEHSVAFVSRIQGTQQISTENLEQQKYNST